jgi:hypothetical protein
VIFGMIAGAHRCPRLALEGSVAVAELLSRRAGERITCTDSHECDRFSQSTGLPLQTFQQSNSPIVAPRNASCARRRSAREIALRAADKFEANVKSPCAMLVSANACNLLQSATHRLR